MSPMIACQPGIDVAGGRTGTLADPVEAMVRPGEISATADLTAGAETDIVVCLRPDDWPQGPVPRRREQGVRPLPARPARPPAADPDRLVRVLAAFAWVTTAPGEQAEARLTVSARAFARYDEAAGTWDRSPGEFTVRVGRSSADLPLHVRVRSS
jgi:hypothetical protein